MPSMPRREFRLAMRFRSMRFRLMRRVFAALVLAVVLAWTSGASQAQAEVGQVVREPRDATDRCAADRRAASRIVRDACAALPALANPNLSESDLATELREWTEAWLPTSSTDTPGYWTLSPDDLYLRLSRGEGGVLCGGAAWMLMTVYEAFGLKAWIYNFGSDPPLTHVATLVQADGKVQLHDPSFQYAVRAPNGEPLDFREALSRLALDGPGALQLEGDSVAARRLIRTSAFTDLGNGLLEIKGTLNGLEARSLRASRASPMRSSAGVCNPAGPTWTECRVSGVRFEAVVSPLGSFGPKVQRFLAGAGYPIHPTSLYRFPIGVSSLREGWREDIDDSENGALFRDILIARGAGYLFDLAGAHAALDGSGYWRGLDAPSFSHSPR